MVFVDWRKINLILLQIFLINIGKNLKGSRAPLTCSHQKLTIFVHAATNRRKFCLYFGFAKNTG